LGELLSTHFPIPSSSLGPTSSGTDNFPILTLHLIYRNWNQYEEPIDLFLDTTDPVQRGQDTEPSVIASIGNSHQLSPPANPPPTTLSGIRTVTHCRLCQSYDIRYRVQACYCQLRTDHLPSEAYNDGDDCAIAFTGRQDPSRSPELPELQTPRDLEKPKVSNRDEIAAIFVPTLAFFFTQIEN